MAEMKKTIDSQNLRIQQLESSKVIETSQPRVELPAPSQPPPAPMSDPDFQKGLKNNLGEAFPWLKGAKFGGDFRLRYEMFDYFDKNNDAGSTGTASDRTRNRFRIRLRWGFDKDYGDDWKMGFRLVTGNNTDQTSTNQTLGNTGYFNFKTINIDRAFALYEPKALKDKEKIKSFKIGAGKFENPFYRYSTAIVWDSDVTPEGLYEQALWNLMTQELNKIDFQMTLGQFLVNENTSLESDASLFGYQGTLIWGTYLFNTDEPVEFATAFSYYDFTNWFQTVKNNSASTSYLRTNSITADSFRVLDIYPEVNFHVRQTPMTLWYNFALNTANVGTDDIVQSGGNDIHDADSAWGVGLKIGKAKKKGSWEATYGYYEIGANAVVAAFNEGDFGGPAQTGFTNRIGHKATFVYQLTDSVAVSWAGLVVKPLNPFNGDAVIGLQNAANERVFKSQVDLNYKF